MNNLLDKLESSAKAATRGKWLARISTECVAPGVHMARSLGPLCDQTPGKLAHIQAEFDAAHIAAASPETILKLVQALRVMRAALQNVYEEPNQMGPVADEIVDEYDIKAWSIASESLATVDKLFLNSSIPALFEKENP